VESGFRRRVYAERERNTRRKKRMKKRKSRKIRNGFTESAINTKSYRIKELLRLERLTGGHPVQTPTHRWIN